MFEQRCDRIADPCAHAVIFSDTAGGNDGVGFYLRACKVRELLLLAQSLPFWA